MRLIISLIISFAVFFLIVLAIIFSLGLVDEENRPDFILGIAGNLLASTVWVLLLLVSLFFIPIWTEWYDRRLKNQFFGLNRSDVKVFLSNLLIAPGGAMALEKVGRGYTGPSLSRMEYSAAIWIQREVGTRVLPRIPRTAYDLIGNSKPDYDKTNVSIEQSWLPVGQQGAVDYQAMMDQQYWISTLDNDSPIIVVGSNIYNSITKYYTDIYSEVDIVKNLYAGFPRFVRNAETNAREICFNEHARMADGAFGSICRTTFVRQVATADAPAVEPAFIARFRDRGVARKVDRSFIIDENSPAKGRTVFICAGLDQDATAASVGYLLNNWRALHQEFQQRGFVIFLEHTKWGGMQRSGKDSREPVPESAREIDRSWTRRVGGMYILHDGGT